jgi:hypothetical protein
MKGIAMPTSGLPRRQPLSPDQVISAMMQHLLISRQSHWISPCALCRAHVTSMITALLAFTLASGLTYSTVKEDWMTVNLHLRTEVEANLLARAQMPEGLQQGLGLTAHGAIPA